MVRLATVPLRVLPDFVILGAARCGTVSLYYYLCAHPNVLPATGKEVHYFDWNAWRGDLWYRSHFPIRRFEQGISYTSGTDPTLITGDHSPDYLFHPLVPERARRLLPDAKLIVLLRNPVDRAFSHFRKMTEQGLENLSFEAALDAEEARLVSEEGTWLLPRNASIYHHRHHSYLARGIYVEQLITWHRHYPKEQMLIICGEDMFSRPSEVYERVLAFLGLPGADIGRFPVHNATGPCDPMPSTVRERLVEYYRPHNRRLYYYLERDFGWES